MICCDCRMEQPLECFPMVSSGKRRSRRCTGCTTTYRAADRDAKKFSRQGRRR